MIVFAIDPGTDQSAFVIWNGQRVIEHAVILNDALLSYFDKYGTFYTSDILAIEKIESFGMPVGKEVLRTVLWSGRFIQACVSQLKPFVEVTRREVKLHICGHSRATDANIRCALIDRFGPPGKKASKGLLYGLKGHEYAALAVAVTYYDQRLCPSKPQ